MVDTSPSPPGLSRSQYEFCLNYVANGFNASAAYRAAHPTASKHTARVEGCRTLIKPAVQEFMATQIGDRWKGLQMDGDEVLARVSMDARADPRLLFDEKGKPFAPADWPDEIANSIESFELHENGCIRRVKFASKAAARRTILEMSGKLKGQPIDSADALADAIRADLARHTKP